MEAVKEPNTTPDSVSKWQESQGFVEKVLAMAHRVAAEVEKNKNDYQWMTDYRIAQAQMAQGAWDSAMHTFNDLVGGKGTVANKSLGDWADRVLSKSDDGEPFTKAADLSSWSDVILRKSKATDEAYVVASVRDYLARESYHDNADKSAYCQHVADKVIMRMVEYGMSEALNTTMGGGGRDAIVSIALANYDSVKSLEVKADEAKEHEMASNYNGL